MMQIPARASELVTAFGSPLYVYDADAIEAAFAGFRSAFTYAPSDHHYAIVCNKNHYIVGLLHALGCGIHANTPGDAYAALRAGVPGDRILYSGTNLNADDFAWLLERRVRMNLDSLDQLRDFAARAPKSEVGLRLLIDDEEARNRIGIAAAELSEAVEMCRSAAIRLTGLHMYAGTNTRRVSRFVDALDRLMTCAPEPAGSGIRRHRRRIRRRLRRRRETVSASRSRRRDLIENGAAVGRCGEAPAPRARARPDSGGRSRMPVDDGHIREATRWPPVHWRRYDGGKHCRRERVSLDPPNRSGWPRGPLLDEPTDVCGNTTHTRDIVAKSCRLPDVAPGDLLILRDVGAYGYAMSSHFLNRPRPAEVVLHRGTTHLTTRRETFEDLVATQLNARV